VADKIYVIGGNTEGSYPPICPSVLNQVYDPIYDSWTNATDMLTANYGCVSAVQDGRIFVFDFSQVGPDLGTHTQIYNPAMDSWSYGKPMPNNVTLMAACATTGTQAPERIYVIGCLYGNSYATGVNQIYDPATDTWTLGVDMPTARSSFALASLDDVLYAVGGEANGVIYTVNEQYLPTGYGVVPEFSNWAPPLVLVVAAFVVFVFHKRKYVKS
jgi:N-acetylneuraminic acid mutarotase